MDLSKYLFSKKSPLKDLAIGLTLIILTSCSPHSFSASSENLSSYIIPNQEQPFSPNTPVATVTPTPPSATPSPVAPVTPQPPSQDSSNGTSDNYSPLAWEKTISEAKNWSAYIYTVIAKDEKQMLADHAATDIEFFCPNYQKLNETQRLNFWGQLIVGIAKFESNWSPISRMVEQGLGKDAITGLQIASEGLMQLSYQDARYHGTACAFDWSKDKALDSKDPRKTIFDPYKNLRCGIQILSEQLDKHRALVIDSGVYWAVLKKSGKYQKIDQIAGYTKSLSFCKAAL